MSWHDGLTEKQRRFVEAYAANGGNATKAAETAGYKKPHPQGAQTLRIVTVQQAIEALRESTTKKSIATREQRQEFWTRVMLGEETIEDPETGKKQPHRMSDRLKAAELLAKAQGDFIERREVTGKDGGALRIVQVPPKQPAQSSQKKLTRDDE